jgi:penicillin-binding protein 1C
VRSACWLAFLLLVAGCGADDATRVAPAVGARALPAFATVRAAYQPSDVQLLDRYGRLLHELRVDAQRRRLAWTPLGEISPALQAAVVAAEDRRFFRHGGVDVLAVLSAAAGYVTGRPLRGASTISMQVATLIAPGAGRRRGPRTLAEKWWQMRAAWALERRWSKAEILEAYLNLATFRGELQGVRSATSVLFGKAPHGLSEVESVVLAALLRSPNAGVDVVERHALALAGRRDGNLPSRTDLSAVINQALTAPPGTAPRTALAPHAARRLLRVIPPYLPVTATLDADVQRAATDILHVHLLGLRDRRVHDGAVLVADNVTGEVLAYVASSGDLSEARHVDGIRAKRQAGSALKPFLYGLALERRLLTPASLLADTPFEIAVAGGLYRPQNYDDQFRGLVTVRSALASSLNIPAVRVLELLGADTFVPHLRQLGFANLVESSEHYGPSLALGGADVSLWEMVGAYRTFANRGLWAALRLAEADDVLPPVRIYSPATAFIVADMLADRASRSLTFGLESPLATRFWTAVKTGTSKDMRDNWCVGFSARYTVGVWVGNFSGRSMFDVSGVTGAAPVWLEVMNWLHRDRPSQPPPPPPGVVNAPVSFEGIAEPGRHEWFLDGTAPHASRLKLAAPATRITAPVSGTTIALDPDIPGAQQRILFEAQACPPHATWVLDGHAVGPGADALMWKPEAGSHRLELRLGVDGRALDTVRFVVRGPRP